MRNYFQSVCIAFLVIIFVQGCKKEKEEVDNDTQSSVDNAQVESIMNELNEISDQAVEDGALSTHRLGLDHQQLTNCAVITVNIDSATGAGTAIVDFGAYFCKGLDQKYRKGLINISFTGAYKNPGTVITVTATNYFTGYDSVFSTKVNAQRTVTNNGYNSDGHLTYGVQANATVVNYLNEQMTWNSTHTREWLQGDSTAARIDDEYSITGNSEGKSFAGVNFTSFINTPLIADLSCQWINKGSVSLTPEGKHARVLDYGNGTCDNLATVVIHDKTFEISIR